MEPSLANRFLRPDYQPVAHDTDAHAGRETLCAIHPDLFPAADGSIQARYKDTILSSAFQPLIFSTGGHSGYEAFVSIGNGRQIKPDGLFAQAATDAELIELDRLCRTLHVLNFKHRGLIGRLFLNVHDRLLSIIRENHGKAFRATLGQIGLSPASITIETPEHVNEHRRLLALVLSNYRRNGFGVAVKVRDLADMDDVLAAVRPDFVKIPASALAAEPDRKAVIALARRRQVRLVITHLEDRGLLPQLAYIGDLLVQGFAIGRPALAITHRRYTPDKEGGHALT